MNRLPPRDHIEREPSFLLRICRKMVAVCRHRRRCRRVSSRKCSEGDDEEDVYDDEEEEDYDDEQDNKTRGTTRQTDERCSASGAELPSLSPEGPATLDAPEARPQRQNTSQGVLETEEGLRSDRRFPEWQNCHSNCGKDPTY